MTKVRQGRRNYLLTLNELNELSKATHSFENKEHAQFAVNEVWKRLGEKYDFQWKTVDNPILGATDVKCISALPKVHSEESDE